MNHKNTLIISTLVLFLVFSCLFVNGDERESACKMNNGKWDKKKQECVCTNSQLLPPSCRVPRCANEGKWLKKKSECLCLPKYVGENCTENYCSKYGEYAGDTKIGGKPKCRCTYPFGIVDMRCIFVSCFHGQAVDGECQCFSGYGGLACEVPLSIFTKTKDTVLEFINPVASNDVFGDLADDQELKNSVAHKEDAGITKEIENEPSSENSSSNDELNLETLEEENQKTTLAKHINFVREERQAFEEVIPGNDHNSKDGYILDKKIVNSRSFTSYLIYSVILLTFVTWILSRSFLQVVFIVCDLLEGNQEYRACISEQLAKKNVWIVQFTNFNSACSYHWFVNMFSLVSIICCHQTSPNKLITPLLGPVVTHRDSRYVEGWKYLNPQTSRVLFVVGPELHNPDRLRDQFEGWSASKFIQAPDDDESIQHMFETCFEFINS
jgi:hypothetical protein